MLYAVVSLLRRALRFPSSHRRQLDVEQLRNAVIVGLISLCRGYVAEPYLTSGSWSGWRRQRARDNAKQRSRKAEPEVGLIVGAGIFWNKMRDEVDFWTARHSIYGRGGGWGGYLCIGQRVEIRAHLVG